MVVAESLPLIGWQWGFCRTGQAARRVSKAFCKPNGAAGKITTNNGRTVCQLQQRFKTFCKYNSSSLFLHGLLFLPRCGARETVWSPGDTQSAGAVIPPPRHGNTLAFRGTCITFCHYCEHLVKFISLADATFQSILLKKLSIFFRQSKCPSGYQVSGSSSKMEIII